MAYRMGRGDYYRGDYYRGSIFSTIGHVVGGAVKGFIGGGPIGGIKGAVSGTVAATKQNMAEGGGSAGAANPIGSSASATPTRDPVIVHKEQAAILRAKNAGLISAGQASQKAAMTVGKTKVLLPSIGGSMAMFPGKRRRMNWANGKALGRAERRIKSAVKHFSKYLRWVSPSKKGKVVPRFGRKK